MTEAEEGLEDLNRVVGEGVNVFERDGYLDPRYVSGVVNPVLGKALDSKIEERHRLDDQVGDNKNFVVHYTSISTVVSMLEDFLSFKTAQDGKEPSLRLYDSLHFNDPDEGNYFVQHMPSKYEWLGVRDMFHAYIASFTIPDSGRDMSDYLPFWRTYGLEGEGCSLKLNAPTSGLLRVLYGSDEAEEGWECLTSILDSLEPLLEIPAPTIKGEVQRSLARGVWGSLETLRFLYKSTAYDYERECRFIVPESKIEPKDLICFEDTTARVRHYYEHGHLALDRILATDSSITLGPCVPHVRSMQYYLKELIRRARLKGEPEVKVSGIAYRRP